METLERQFKSRVGAFLERTGMKPTTFGKKALGDPNLLRQIERGRSLSLKTADRVLAFTVAYGGTLPASPDPETAQVEQGEDDR